VQRYKTVKVVYAEERKRKREAANAKKAATHK
jgi:hypothetical protein